MSLEKAIELLGSLGYEPAGVYDRTQLDLSKVERCEVIEGVGSCACNIDLDITLHEVDVCDIAIIIESTAFGFVESFTIHSFVKSEEPYKCEGEIELELYIETETASLTINKVKASACTAWV